MTHAAPITTYTVQEVAQLFKTSVYWVRSGVQQGRFPFLRLGGKRGPVRFTDEHIKQIAQLHEQPAKETPSAGEVPGQAVAAPAVDVSVFGASSRSAARNRKPRKAS
ncbi:helix-turn-helix domain-containing protein [Amycolatopsis thermophila]|uniref:Helix-turn-helix domain-containing protein n=1 Tax=Amycolatopsis thermophila TaxID=206084 RepID=A0ABU0EMW3_9PSEU|nr:helix-turn-helix domain-containing protein [Amycolatopsis thermophila]MDQ0376636.1 hypothetical protein [Amycolatopsis thermophila]